MSHRSQRAVVTVSALTLLITGSLTFSTHRAISPVATDVPDPPKFIGFGTTGHDSGAAEFGLGFGVVAPPWRLEDLVQRAGATRIPIDHSRSQRNLSPQEQRAVVVAKTFLERDLVEEVSGYSNYYTVNSQRDYFLVTMEYVVAQDGDELYWFGTTIYVSQHFEVVATTLGL